MRRKGLTLMELLTVISILATLAALMYPVFLRVRSKIYAINCANQLRQIGLAIRMYINDYGGDYYAIPPYWGKLYPHYISDKQLLVCPYFQSLAPEVVEERNEIEIKRWKQPWTSYDTIYPKGMDYLARKYPDELIGFSEAYAQVGDQVVIGICIVHRVGCPNNIQQSPKGRRFCAEYCTDPNVYLPDEFKGISPIPPGKLSDLSQPLILLKLSGSVVFDHGGTWMGPSSHLIMPP